MNTITIPPELLNRAIKGDADAFSEIMEASQKAVYNLCFRMLSNPNDAEDSTQETFLRAYRNIKHYDDKRPFITWLLSIAAHHCIDQLRKRRMTLISTDEDPQIDLLDLNPGPEVSFGNHERQQQVQSLLNTLPAQDRAAVVMLYWYDLSYEEIGEALHLTVSAVKSRLHRARISLAQSWSEDEKKTLYKERYYHGSPAL